MKKTVYYLMLMAYMTGFTACSSSEETTENLNMNMEANNQAYSVSSLEEADIEYVDFGNLPEWLRSWITSSEEKVGLSNTIFREGAGNNPRLFRGNWEGKVYYYIHNDLNSCVFCDSFYEDGTRLDFEDEEVKKAFDNAIGHMKRVFVKYKEI